MNQLLRALLCVTLFMTAMVCHGDNIISRTNGCCNVLQCDEDHSSADDGLCSLPCSTCCFNCGITTFIPRSQGANTARELVAWQRQLYLPYYIENYITVAFATEYTRSFRSNRIARTLFCTDCLTFSGSQAHRNNGVDIVADYFGLPTNFRGTLAIRPRIENYILDFNTYFGFNELLPGLYLRLHAPLTHTKWTLGLDECVACADKFRGDDFFPNCYMYSATPPTTPVLTASSSTPGTCFINNAVDPTVIIDPILPGVVNAVPYHCTTHSLREALSGNFTFGDMTERWRYGRFSFCPRNKTQLADLDIILGYNFIETDYSHFGLYLQVVAPTGSRPKAKYIFEPIAGNGKHWELGAGITAHFTLYNDRYIDGYTAAFYLEGNVTNVFKTDQRRSFDFRQNGLLSRYLLLKEFDVNNNYIGRMINAINFATRNAEVHVGYKVDMSAKFAINHGGWIADLGYNIYARSRETVCIKTECPCDIDQRRFGIKGIAGVCCSQYIIGLVGGVPSVVPNNTMFPTMASAPADCSPLPPIAMTSVQLDNALQPTATMFTVTPLTSVSVPDNACTACLSYNSQPIIPTAGLAATPTANLTPAHGFIVSSSTVPVNGIIVNHAPTPVIVTCADLDPNSAAQCSMLTHKFFAHVGYVWNDYCFQPHIGLGAEVEVDGKRVHNSLNQWGVWIKGGITY
jgi:hypothetical protein